MGFYKFVVCKGMKLISTTDLQMASLTDILSGGNTIGNSKAINFTLSKSHGRNDVIVIPFLILYPLRTRPKSSLILL